MKRISAVIIAEIGLGAALIAICSWIAIPIGSVPITLQTFAVLLVVGVFGLKSGLSAVAVYITIGAIGIPVFASFNSGIAYIMGPTGGYIIGFIFTALIEGLLIDKFNRFKFIIPLSMIIGILVCYFFGTIWFITYFSIQGNEKSVASALMTCVIPFLIPDFIKVLLATILTVKLKKLFNKIRRL